MGRISKARLLSPEGKAQLKTIIRAHDYCQLDAMIKAVRENGILMSRSALHRYVQMLAKTDAVKCHEMDTVVIIVSRSTGKTLELSSNVPAEEIEAAIRQIPPPDSVALCATDLQSPLQKIPASDRKSRNIAPFPL